MRRVKALYAVCVSAVLVLVCLSLPGCNNDSTGNINVIGQGAVYTMTNAATGNAVVAFRQGGDGTLTFLNTYPTGGNGTGPAGITGTGSGIDPLSSQGSLIISRDGRFLFAVNAGSNTVTSFRIAPNGVLTKVDTKPSGGAQPNSLANFGNLLYVSNVGNATNASNVSGFHVNGNGTLTPIADSTHALSTGTALPSSLAFSPNGKVLEVSESTTNKVDIFTVNTNGTLTGPVANTSSGAGPFGSVFLSSGPLLVAEAGAGAVSSYTVNTDGTLTAISPSVVNGQAATCWLSVTPDERFAFTSNTGSSTISSYALNGTGALTLLEGTAFTGPTGSAPVDNKVSPDGRFFYVLNDGAGNITAFSISNDGHLTSLGNVSDNIPATGAQGLAVH